MPLPPPLIGGSSANRQCTERVLDRIFGVSRKDRINLVCIILLLFGKLLEMFGASLWPLHLWLKMWLMTHRVPRSYPRMWFSTCTRLARSATKLKPSWTITTFLIKLWR